MRSRSSLSLLPRLLALGALAGCTSSGPRPDAATDAALPDASSPVEGGPTGDLRRPTEMAPVGDELVLAICATLRRCQAELGPAFASDADCSRHFTRLYGCDRVAGAVNTAARQRCLSWLEGASCAEAPLRFGCVALGKPLACGDPLSQWGRLGAPGCGYVFLTPAAAADASCEVNGCDEGLFCKRGSTSAVCPVCRPAAAAAAPCLDSPVSPAYQACGAGLTCASGFCVPRLAHGKPCQKDSQCTSGFCRSSACAAPLRLGEAADLLALDQCAGFMVARADACAARRSTGQPCTYDVDCLLDAVCVKGVCQQREVCGARQPGEPCVTEPLGCAPSAFCNNTAELQLCEARHPLGQPCEFTDDCQDGAYCSLGEKRCTAYAGEGGSCAGALLCAKSFYCDDAAGSRCTPRRADGAKCSYGYECQSTYCASSVGTCAPKPACSMP